MSKLTVFNRTSSTHVLHAESKEQDNKIMEGPESLDGLGRSFKFLANKPSIGVGVLVKCFMVPKAAFTQLKVIFVIG